MPELKPGTSRLTLALCLAAVWVILGSIYLAIRLVINEVDPFQGMAQRFLIAGLVLAGVVVARRGWAGLRVPRAQLGVLVLTGVLLLGLGNGLQALAQTQGLPSGVAGLVVASVPAWAVLLRVLTGDRPSTATLVGVGLGLAGLVVLLALGRGLGATMPLGAALLALVASLSWTIGSFLQGVLELPDDLFAIATYQQLVAAACSSVLAVLNGEQLSMAYSWRGWLALAYLVVFCSIVAFVAYIWLLRHVPLSLTATHAYVNPVIAVALGWLVLSEPVNAAVLVGGGIVVGSVVVIVNAERGERGEPATPAEAPAPWTRAEQLSDDPTL